MDTYAPKYNNLKRAGFSSGYTNNEKSLSKISSRIITLETINNMRDSVQSEKKKIKISKAIGIPVKVLNMYSVKKVKIFI